MTARQDPHIRVARQSVVANRIDAVVHSVARACEISDDEIVSADRRERLVMARAAVVWIARTELRVSWRWIGLRLGARDRSTILNAFRRAESLRNAEPAFRSMCDRLITEIEAEKSL